MKKNLLFLMLLLCINPLLAQNALNEKGDNIVGTYSGKQGDDKFKVKVTKQSDDTYQGQVIWLEHDRDAKGNKLLDTKNPDKSLRSKPADQIVLFSGLKYDEKKHCWNNTKIYDPQRGLRAHMAAEFTSDGRLRVKGSLVGISESVYWTREK